MGAVMIYKEEVVGHHIECDCGYIGDYHDYTHSDFGHDVRELWTCPECGKTFELEED